MAQVVVPIGNYSDGDATHRPTEARCLVDETDFWLKKLGTGYMQATGRYVEGESSILPFGHT